MQPFLRQKSTVAAAFAFVEKQRILAKPISTSFVTLNRRLSSTTMTSPVRDKTLDRINAAISCVPEFQQFKADDFYVEPLRGGLTNLLWTVGLKRETSRSTTPTDEDDDLSEKQQPVIKKGRIHECVTIALVREYGRGTESFMNRAQEERVVEKLCKEGLCPHVYGVFPWGRVERFLCNSRNLSTIEYASFEHIPKVSELLGKFHAQKHVLLPLCTTTGEQSQLRERLHHWHKIASQVHFPGDDQESRRKQRKVEALDLQGQVKAEIEWLLNEISEVGSPVVFCHCDLQEGNVLLHNEEMHMIDFEYSDRLERGFDFGNCFCEMSIDYKINKYPGFVLNPDMFPDEQKQIEFLRGYARGAGIEFTEAAKTQLLKEAAIFVMGSHLHWSIWSVVQAQHSTIEFGYLEYAEQRLDQYYNLKGKWNAMKSM